MRMASSVLIVLLPWNGQVFSLVRGRKCKIFSEYAAHDTLFCRPVNLPHVKQLLALRPRQLDRLVSVDTFFNTGYPTKNDERVFIVWELEPLIFDCSVPTFTCTDFQIVASVKRATVEHILDGTSQARHVPPVRAVILSRRGRGNNSAFDMARLSVVGWVDL